MKKTHTIRTMTLTAMALIATACGEAAQSTAESIANETRKGIAEATAPGGEVDRAMAEARRKLHEENLKLEQEGIAAKAELTPQGDLLINGVAVPLTAEQREATLAYRTKVLEVAEGGMVIGQQGAALGGEAAALAIESIFKGDAGDAQQKIEAEAKKIEAAALALCRSADGLRETQERLVALVPEFAPYAKSFQVTGECEASDGSGDAESPESASI